MPNVSREHSSDAAASPLWRPRGREEIQPLLRELKGALEDLYGERLAKLVLYGSFARGDATDASDIDVLVVLRGEVEKMREIDQLVDHTYPMLLKHGELISAHPVSERAYRERRTPFLMNVRREGVRV
jgi:predicted nucleotidyltransferase